MISIASQQQYPLEQCATCLHINVCKWAENLVELQEMTPINLTHAECNEYYDLSAPMPTTEDESAVESIYSKLVGAIERYMVSTGLTPGIVCMNKATKDEFVKQVSPDYEPEDGADVPIYYIELGEVVLIVSINNSIPTGEFIVAGGKGEEDEQ